MKSIRLFAVAALLSPVLAFAQPNPPASVDQRQARQQERIEQGVASGELTRKEAARLERGQASVARKEARAQADGVVTPRENARLQHAQDVQSRKIHRQKHDRQHDYDHNGRKDRPGRG